MTITLHELIAAIGPAVGGEAPLRREMRRFVKSGEGDPADALQRCRRIFR